MLAGFAKAFRNGIIIESSLGLDSINACQTIVYDRFDGVEVTEEELELFRKLSHMGRIGIRLLKILSKTLIGLSIVSRVKIPVPESLRLCLLV